MRAAGSVRHPARPGRRRTAVLVPVLAAVVLLPACEGRLGERVAERGDEPADAVEQEATGDPADEGGPAGDGALDPDAVESVERAVEEAEDAVASLDQELDQD